MEIDERFAFIELEDGTRFQKLLMRPNDAGEAVPVDWDEKATHDAVNAYLDQQQGKA